MSLVEQDFSDCPYYLSGWSGGPGHCVYNCYDEPACITERPADGWPRERSSLVKRLALYLRMFHDERLCDYPKVQCDVCDALSKVPA